MPESACAPSDAASALGDGAGRLGLDRLGSGRVGHAVLLLGGCAHAAPPSNPDSNASSHADSSAMSGCGSLYTWAKIWSRDGAGTSRARRRTSAATSAASTSTSSKNDGRRAAALEPRAVAGDRVALGPVLDLGVGAVLRGIVGGGVRAHAVGQGLDEAGALAGARLLERLPRDGVADRARRCRRCARRACRSRRRAGRGGCATGATRGPRSPTGCSARRTPAASRSWRRRRGPRWRRPATWSRRRSTRAPRHPRRDRPCRPGRRTGCPSRSPWRAGSATRARACRGGSCRSRRGSTRRASRRAAATGSRRGRGRGSCRRRARGTTGRCGPAARAACAEPTWAASWPWLGTHSASWPCRCRLAHARSSRREIAMSR